MKTKIAQSKGATKRTALFIGLIYFFSQLNAQQFVNWKEGIIYNNGLESDPVVLDAVTFNTTIQNHKLVMLDFFTTCCDPCEKSAPFLEEIKLEFQDSLIVIKIDAEPHSKFAKQYGISAYPTFILLSHGVDIEGDPILSSCHIRELLPMLKLQKDYISFEQENSPRFEFREGSDCYYFNFGNSINMTYDDDVAEVFARKHELVSQGKGYNLIEEQYWTPTVKGNPIIQTSPIGFVGCNGKIYESGVHYRRDPEIVKIDPEIFGRYPANKGGGLKLKRL